MRQGSSRRAGRPAGGRGGHPDPHRLEKVSALVKAFKLACARAGSQFGGVSVGNSTFSAVVECFTSSTLVLITASGVGALTTEGRLVLLQARRAQFEKALDEVGGI